MQPVTQTKAGKPLGWEGVGLLPQGIRMPGSPSKMDVTLIAPCKPEGEATFTDGETEAQKGTRLGHGNPGQKLLAYWSSHLRVWLRAPQDEGLGPDRPLRRPHGASDRTEREGRVPRE